ncbi:MAG: DUF975 family protein, partial [Firmicutes bacterium]|nr:DUF975 family protein [Bacillota bacterium]
MPQGEMVYTTTGEIKSLSKSSLLGFWGKLLICYFILFAITQYIPGFLSRIIPGLTYVYDFEYMGIKDRIEYAILPVFFMAILNGPFRYGISKIHLRQIRERSMESNDLFSGFANFGKSFATYVLMWLIILIVAIPFVAVGTLIVVFLSKSGTALQILGSFLYMIALVAGLIAVIYISVLLAMSFYILVDNPNLKPKEALKASATIMKKNVGRFVVLRLSYLGWIFLASMV